MTAPAFTVAVQPLAVDRATAAAMLMMSVDSFERLVQPHIRMVRSGRLRVVPVSELQRWLDENAEFTLDRGGRR
jgi:hypothetical protein